MESSASRDAWWAAYARRVDAARVAMCVNGGEVERWKS